MKRITRIFTLILLVFSFSCARQEGPLDFFWQMDPAEKHYDAAERQFTDGSYDRALKLYQSYLLKYPDTQRVPAVLMKVGLLHVNQKQYEKAHVTFQQVIGKYPDSSYAGKASVETLAILYAQGKYQQTIEYYQEVLQADLSNNLKLRAGLIVGDSYMAFQLPLNAYTFFLFAYENAGLKDRQKVMERIKSALSLMSPQELSGELEKLNNRPPSGYLMYQQGLNDMEAGRLDDAMVSFSAFIDRFPDHAQTDMAKQLISDLESSVLYDRNIIGCILPLTGKYESIGRQALNGIEYALAAFAKREGVHSIKILIKDSASDPDLAKQAVRELADSQVSAIIGPIITAEAAAIQAQELRVPIIVMTQKRDITDVGDYVFRNFLTPKMQIKALVEYVVGVLGEKRFAILYPDESYGDVFMNLFWDEVTDAGGQIVGVEAYNPEHTDFADPIKKLVGLYYDIPQDLVEKIPPEIPMVYNDRTLAAMRNMESTLSDVFPVAGDGYWADKFVEYVPADEAREPQKDEPEEEPESIVDFDAVFIPDSPNKAGLIIPQLAYYDIKDVYLLGTNLWHSEKLVRMAKYNIQGAILPEGFFSESSSAIVNRFVTGFDKTYGSSPGFIEAVSFDTAMILFDLVSRPEIRFRTHVKRKLLDMEPFLGVTGKTVFDSSGEAEKDIYLLKIARGRFQEVDRRKVEGRR